MSAVSRLELLSKDNYDTWVLQVEALLVKNDLWEYVSGECIKPADTEDLAVKTWLKNDKKARADIILSINPMELKQIRGCDTSRQVWLKLENIYASKGPAKKATLLKQLMLQKLEDNGNVREHLTRFFDTVDKLESMEVKINGDMLAIMLLYSLPSSFQNFRCAIETRDELPSAESLKIKIMEESEARKQDSDNTVIALAANVRKYTGQDTYKNTMKVDFKCFKCGKIGHKANVCSSKRKFGTKQTQNKENIFSALTIENAYNVNGYRKWILDSGCTSHLCGDRQVFHHIDESINTKINLANEASAEVQGKGSVQINLNDRETVQLQNTLFVPDLRTN